MKNGAIVLALVMVLGILSGPASAQNAVGGPKKQSIVGGAAKQNSPVVPANKGGSTVVSSPPKCPGGSCVAKGRK
jgi:hypothetical protein